MSLIQVEVANLLVKIAGRGVVASGELSPVNGLAAASAPISGQYRTVIMEPLALLTPDFPAPMQGLLLTHFLVVRDQDRARDFYCRIFDAKIARERDPVMLRIANSWLILNEGGGPTDDKPETTLLPPKNIATANGFLNVRVADIYAIYRDWTAKGATFLTEPKDHGEEIRCYVCDPDGHLIEVGQTTDGLR